MSARLVRMLAVGAMLLSSGACHDLGIGQGRMLDRTALAQTFDEEFHHAPDFWDAKTNPAGRWKTNYSFSVQDTDAANGWESRTLAPNGEGQYYGDPAKGMSAFTSAQGVLTITGQPNRFRTDPRTHGLPYLSGLITTEKSFNQRYGYFEIRAALPMGKGIWPAFWLLPQPRMVDGWAQSSGQQEIDVFESIGEGGTLYFTDFSDDGGRKVADETSRTYYTSADLTQFHTYGVLVTPKNLTWYVDDRQVRRRPNIDFHMPAYMLINLAIGGEWPGMPDQTTRFPARMQIDWVRAYRLKTDAARD